MNIVGQKLSERKQGDVFYDTGSDVCVRTNTAE